MAKHELAEFLEGPDFLSLESCPFADNSGEVAGAGGPYLRYFVNSRPYIENREAVAALGGPGKQDVGDEKQVVLAAASAAAGLGQGILKQAYSAGDIQNFNHPSPRHHHTRPNISSLVSVPETGTIDFESVAIPDSFTSSSQAEAGSGDISEMEERSPGNVLGILSTEELEEELRRRKTPVGPNTPALFGPDPVGMRGIQHRRGLQQVTSSQGAYHPFQTSMASSGLSVLGPSAAYQVTNQTLPNISSMNTSSSHSVVSSPSNGLSQGLIPQLVGSLSSSLRQPSYHGSQNQGVDSPARYARPIQYGASPRETSRYVMPPAQSVSKVQPVYQPSGLSRSSATRSLDVGSYSVQPGMSYAQHCHPSRVTVRNTLSQDESLPSNLRKCHSTPILPSVIGGSPSMQLPVRRGEVTNGERRIGKLTREERMEKILRYRQKRPERRFDRRVTYQCRKTLADTRPRVRGRFARNDDKDAVMPPERKGGTGKRRKKSSVELSAEVKKMKMEAHEEITLHFATPETPEKTETMDWNGLGMLE